MKEWEKGITLGVAETLNENRGLSTSKAYGKLKRTGLDTITPISKVRQIAKRFSRKYRIPIILDISEKHFKEHPEADALHHWEGGKSTIYLHPILQYYTPRYIEGVIEHEIDHARVEEKWEEKL